MRHAIIFITRFLTLKTILLMLLTGEILCSFHFEIYFPWKQGYIHVKISYALYLHFLFYCLSIASVMSKDVFHTPSDLLKNLRMVLCPTALITYQAKTIYFGTRWTALGVRWNILEMLLWKLQTLRIQGWTWTGIVGLKYHWVFPAYVKMVSSWKIISQLLN